MKLCVSLLYRHIRDAELTPPSSLVFRPLRKRNLIRLDNHIMQERIPHDKDIPIRRSPSILRP